VKDHLHAGVTFLNSFGGNGFHVAEIEEGDISRIAELVEQYVSLPLSIVDAAVDRRAKAYLAELTGAAATPIVLHPQPRLSPRCWHLRVQEVRQ
jgi:hypothetical protein